MIKGSELIYIKNLLDKHLSNWTIEIGGGLGFLTELIKKRKEFSVFEIDETLHSLLAQRFGKEVVKKDIRSWNPENETSSGSLVGNLPYYLSGRILWTVAQWPQKINHAVFTVQKEVAERVCSNSGTKSFGALSGPLQHFYSCKIQKILSSECFFPRPKVESAVLTLLNKEKKEDFKHAENYLMLNKIMFSQRRKKVKNLLKNIVSESAIKKIPEGFRAEDLDSDLGLFLVKNLKSK